MEPIQKDEVGPPTLLLSKQDIIIAVSAILSESTFFPECIGVEAKSMTNTVEVYLYYEKKDFKRVSMAETINITEQFLRDCLPLTHRPCVYVIETPQLDPHEQYMFIKREKMLQEVADAAEQDIKNNPRKIRWERFYYAYISPLIFWK